MLKIKFYARTQAVSHCIYQRVGCPPNVSDASSTSKSLPCLRWGYLDRVFAANHRDLFWGHWSWQLTVRRCAYWQSRFSTKGLFPLYTIYSFANNAWSCGPKDHFPYERMCGIATWLHWTFWRELMRYGPVGALRIGWVKSEVHLAWSSGDLGWV